MCGIAGILRTWQPGQAPTDHAQAIPEAWLDIVDDSIKHRGPDGRGRFRQRVTRPDGTTVDVALVHRRLAIIDPADGAQPMLLGSPIEHPAQAGGHAAPERSPPLVSREGAPYEPARAHQCPRCGQGVIAVAFNGCIYNHRELRRELEAAGHVFHTDHSDTEVLLHGWKQWGLGLADRVDGMAAVLAWDAAIGQFLVGRDIAGEKPLYQLGLGNGSVWCSSSAALSRLYRLQDPAASLVCPLHLDDWVRFGWAVEPVSTAYEGEPGTWRMSPPHPLRGGSERGRFSVKERVLPSRRSTASLDEARLGALLEAAVVSRMDADVPLGTFLSGGLDSALITAIASRHRPDIRAYTVRMPSMTLDESGLATQTAGVIGCRHTVLDCDPSPAEDVVRLIEQLGLPFGDSSLLPTYWVSRAASAEIRVALSGDGGDELFGGYQRHEVSRFLTARRSLLAWVPSVVLPSRNPRGRSSKLRRLTDAARCVGYDDLLAVFPYADLKELMILHVGEPLDAGERFWPQEDPLLRDFGRYLPFDILRKSDTASMAVPLEVRAPLLSRELIDACLSAPLASLMPNGQRKGLLRAVARRYLPAEIVDRPKMGFAVPIGEWFRTDYGGMRQLLYDHLEAPNPFPGLAEAGVELNRAFIARMLREHDAAGERSINPWHGRDHSQRLYMLLVLSIWCRWLKGL
jgi:asparagine synthase (glutamine-hydrolysing)